MYWSSYRLIRLGLSTRGNQSPCRRYRRQKTPELSCLRVDYPLFALPRYQRAQSRGLYSSSPVCTCECTVGHVEQILPKGLSRRRRIRTSKSVIILDTRSPRPILILSVHRTPSLMRGNLQENTWIQSRVQERRSHKMLNINDLYQFDQG